MRFCGMSEFFCLFCQLAFSFCMGLIDILRGSVGECGAESKTKRLTQCTMRFYKSVLDSMS